MPFLEGDNFFFLQMFYHSPTQNDKNKLISYLYASLSINCFLESISLNMKTTYPSDEKYFNFVMFS